MRGEGARPNNLSNFFDVKEPTDGIHFHTVQKNVNATRTLKSIKLPDDILVMLMKSGVYKVMGGGAKCKTIKNKYREKHQLI